MTTSFAGTAALLRLGWRRDRWIITAAVLTMVATAYGSMAATLDLYPDDAQAAAGARAMAENPSVTALYGPVPSLTAAGVGVVKTITMGSLFAAFLAFAIVRRHTRTEEEEGRFELVGGGVVGRRAPLTAALCLAVLSVLATGALCALALLPTGVDPVGAAALGVTILVAGLVMAGITAVAVQLTATTRGAGGIAIAALGLAFVVRAGADTSERGQDLVYASFLGWAERVSPFGDNRLWLVVPALARPRCCWSLRTCCSSAATSERVCGPPGPGPLGRAPGWAPRSASRGGCSAAPCWGGRSGMPCWARSSAASPPLSPTSPPARGWSRCCAR